MGSGLSSESADMSTIETNGQGQGWPHFPPEIWLRILRVITDVPDPLVYPHLILSDAKISQKVLSEHAYRRYRESLIVKRLIVSVCRQWYAFGNELLFEHLVIDRPWQLGVLLQTLPRLPAGRIDPDDRRTLGWFVKRLDLLIPNIEWLRIKRQDSEVFSLAPTLCTFLPNLLSLNVAGAPVSYFPPGTDVISPRLKQLCWSDDGTSPTLENFKDLILFMENHPNVTVVCFPPTDVRQWPPESNASPSDWEGVCWPEVEELAFTTSVRIRVFYNAFRAGTFPGLRRLACPYTSPETLGQVLRFCGANLERLHLSHYSTHTKVFWTLDSTLMVIKAIQGLCPNLQEFRWSLKGKQLPDGEWADSLDDAGARIPGVTTFGAHWISPIEGGYGYGRFCRHILCWARIFPDLKVVRLFGEENVQALLEEGKVHFLNGLLEECRLKEVRVEDIFGRRITQQGVLV